MLPGDQHKDSGPNPYEEKTISQYTAVEIATLQAKLDQQLGPEFISSRAGPGGKKVHYIQADKCINLANQVFGFNGWCSSIQRVDVDYLDQSKDGKWSIGIAVIIRVTLKDGTYHEDMGYGTMEGGKTKAQVFEKARKEGTTDGLKRALRNFGKVLGNCLYDQEYLTKVSKIKAPTRSFDEKKLHRHGDSTVIPKQELVQVVNIKDHSSPEAYDEYGGKEFEELGIFSGGDDVFDDLLTDEGPLETRSPLQHRSTVPEVQKCSATPSRAVDTRGQMMGRQQQINTGPGINRSMPPPAPSHNQNSSLVPRAGSPQVQSVGAGQTTRSIGNTNPNQRTTRPARPLPRQMPGPQPQQVQLQHAQAQPQTPGAKPLPTPPTSGPHNPPVGFFTGKAAYDLVGDDKVLPQQAPTFNPHRPTTIPRTSGIDHTKSSPVPRKLQAPPNERPEAARLNFENPSLNTSRQIGMPPQNRAPFRAPGSSTGPSGIGTKRPAEVAPVTASRTALSAASGAHLNVQNGVGNDPKRAKT